MLNDPSAWVALLGITPPIVVTILIAAWLNNRRIDSIDSSLSHRIGDLDGSLNHRIDDVNASLNRRIDDLRVEIVPLLREILSSVKDLDRDRKSTRLNSSHIQKSRMPSSA